MAKQSKSSSTTNKSKLFLAISDSSHKTLYQTKFSRSALIIGIVAFFIAIIAGIYSLVAYTPIRNTIPGYPNAQSKLAAIQNQITIDSLKSEIRMWEMQLTNIQRIVTGQEPISLDSLITSKNQKLQSNEGTHNNLSDSLLREEVLKQEQFTISATRSKIEQIEGLHYFKPVQGVVTEGFNKAINHPYLDVAAPEGTIVYSILDGAVISAGWDDLTGYTIQIQHSNNLLSIYKHNQRLLKSTGDKIEAGTPIAFVGNTGEITTGSHLHFELWHNGEAIDPTLYINF